MTRRPTGLALLLLLACLLAWVPGGCAWANRENRTTWNAFETHVVPENDVLFYATLPLTVPGGLLAILVDAFIVHPISIGDDAYADAEHVWDGMEWEQEYYTELVLVPFRVVATPVVFVFSFLGRSLFDIGSHDPSGPTACAPAPEELEAHRKEKEQVHQASLAQKLEDWLGRLADGSTEIYSMDPPAEWTDALARAFARARRQATARGRYRLFRYAQDEAVFPWKADPTMGLRDDDPVVRYLILSRWPTTLSVSDDLRKALLFDPSESVRQLAHARWGATD